MPRNVWFMDRLDSIVIATLRLVLRGAVTGPSLRAVATEAGISPAGVVHHFGSADRLWGLVAQRWAEERALVHARVRDGRSVVALLSETPAGVDDQVFDFALAVIARGHSGVARALTGLREAERARLSGALPDLGERELDQLIALIEGLRFAMGLPEGALPISRARAALENFVERLTSAS